MRTLKRRGGRVKVPLKDQAAAVPPGLYPWIVYVLTDQERKRFSISMAKDVDGRVFRHKERFDPAVTVRTPLLVVKEPYADRHTAIARMKRLRRWSSAALKSFVSERNPGWQDLAQDIEA